MKRSAGTNASGPAQPEPKYASIDEIVPRYTEFEAGQRVPTHEEKPRTRPPLAAPGPGVQWRRNAIPFADLNSRPLIAIVIDDVGLDRPRSKRTWELPGPLTLSFLPYAKELREQIRAARAAGKEIMLHLPMEPAGRAEPGPGALLVTMPDNEIGRRTAAALDAMDVYVGANNHMGSRFTAFKPGMQTVLQQVRARGMLFLDSRTTAQTVAEQVALETGVPTLPRNVFLDDEETLVAVKRKLGETEEIARRLGYAVAIGHPHDVTIQALAEWLPTLQAKGFALAPITAVLRKRNGGD
ncbi:MAG: divergent polysaccharide deacetylase family protein [Acidimicrobiia bacterium]